MPFCVCFSLLREHSIDGTGWAPTRTLKVECPLPTPTRMPLHRQPASCKDSDVHAVPSAWVDGPTLPTCHRPPGAAGQALALLSSSAPTSLQLGVGIRVSGHLLSPLPFAVYGLCFGGLLFLPSSCYSPQSLIVVSPFKQWRLARRG